MSSSSAFHGGDVASAIQSARASARPLLVALHPGGDDARSASLDAVWADDDVRGELGDHWVAVRLEASTAAHRNFAQIYPAHASRVPSVVALNPNDGSVLFASGDGDPDEARGVGTNAKATRGKLRSTRAAFQKAMAAAAMAALARMAAATGAGNDTAAQTIPSARTTSTTPGTTAPGTTAPIASASAPASASKPERLARLPSEESEESEEIEVRETRVVTARTPVVSPPEKEKERENRLAVSRPRDCLKEKPGGKDVSAKPAKPPAKSVALRVTLADGSTATGALPVGATLGDARAFIENQKKNDEPFEIWNTWPRERVDGGEDADAHERRARTLESLGLGVRPSLLVVRPRNERDAKPERKRATPLFHGLQNASARAASAGAGGALAALMDLLRRVWATLAMFLGIGLGPSPGSSGGGGGTARAEAAFGTQDAAWAAATRGVEASSRRIVPGSRPRGGGGGGGGARGNVHTLGSSRVEDDLSDDRANRFDNGNSTVWGGDDGGDDGRGGDGTAADAF